MLPMKALLTLSLALITFFPRTVLPASGKELLNEAIKRDSQTKLRNSISGTPERARVIELYSRAIESGQLNKYETNKAFVNRARLYVEEKKCPTAIEDLDKAIGTGYRNALANTLRPYCHHEAGSLDAALKDFDSAITLNPRDPILFRERASILAAQQKYDGAVKDISVSIRLLKPLESADLFVLRGDTFFAKGQYERSVADYMEAIRIKKLREAKTTKHY